MLQKRSILMRMKKLLFEEARYYLTVEGMFPL